MAALSPQYLGSGRCMGMPAFWAISVRRLRKAALSDTPPPTAMALYFLRLRAIVTRLAKASTIASW